MTINEIKQMKNEGIKKELYRQICSRMFDIKMASEKSTSEAGKNFIENVEKIKILVIECEQLHEEWQKI